MMTINTNSMLDEECGQKLFDSVTDEELIYLWRWIKGRGISANEAWNVALTGLARQGIRQEQNVYADRTLGNKNVMNVLRATE